jgi:hypothetical protein
VLPRKNLKKNFAEAAKSILPTETDPQDVEIWFQDEHRIGQQGSLTRVWARKGTRPRIPRQQQFIAAYIFGAVCPKKDKGAAVIVPYANTYAMQVHLDEIAQQVEAGKHAVVVLDKAGWHTSKSLQVPKNISLLSLPPYSPELNPQEQVGRQMKHNDLANRSFKNYDDIVEASTLAWKNITAPGNIQSLCFRSWASL